MCELSLITGQSVSLVWLGGGWGGTFLTCFQLVVLWSQGPWGPWHPWSTPLGPWDPYLILFGPMSNLLNMFFVLYCLLYCLLYCIACCPVVILVQDCLKHILF